MDTEEKKLAPIILFAFKRLIPLKKTIESLLLNEEAKDSILYIFVDGAREEKPLEKEKVQTVQSYVKEIKGFKSVHYFFSEQNKGLGKSIIEGVTQIINQYGNAIVLEDDLILATNFLSFMNQGLNLYEKESKVFSICGYTNKIKTPKNYPYDSYFCTRSSSWGWATWADRWNSVDWELTNWNSYSKTKKNFNKWGGSDCFRMLRSVKEGKGNSWAIRFCFAQFLQDKLSLFPIISKVKNEGFDGEGTNCKKWSRFKHIFDISNIKKFNFPTSIELNKQLYKSAMSYHSIPIRIYSRIMYLIHN
ncbi:glycosyl transferase [Phocaeicola sp. HCN-40430]|uniref:glycosyl transferase n=1 Tax=Phocaeicola sp. HCN-40430 TaxID=3134664 RepID=UPI0030C06390